MTIILTISFYNGACRQAIVTIIIRYLIQTMGSELLYSKLVIIVAVKKMNIVQNCHAFFGGSSVTFALP